MRVVVESHRITDAVKRAVKVAANNPTIPILSCLHLEADGDRLTVSACDLDHWISVTVPAEVEAAGSTALPAKEMASIVGAVPDGSQMTIGLEGTLIAVKTAVSLYQLCTMDPDDFPAMAELDPILAKFTISQAAMIEAFDAVRPWVSPKISDRLYYQGIALGYRKADSGGEMVFLGAEARGLSEYALPAPEGAEGLGPADKMIGLEAATAVASLPGGDEANIQVEVSDSKFAFQCQHVRFVTAQIGGSFPPEYEAVIPEPGKTSFTCTVGQLADALSCAAAIADDPAVIFDIAGSGFTLTAQGAGPGAVRTALDAKLNGPADTLSLNGPHLSAALGGLPGDKTRKVTVHTGLSHGEAFRIVYEGLDNMRTVMMPRQSKPVVIKVKG